MKSCITFGLLIVGIALGARAEAAEPSGGWWLWPGISLHPPCCCCCDDYCPKPLPCVAPFKCFGCDDYCPKPLPCVAPFKCFGCDDYCPKPCVVVEPLCCGPNYTCGPPPACNQPQCGCLPAKK
jgi:hypothetical protein